MNRYDRINFPYPVLSNFYRDKYYKGSSFDVSIEDYNLSDNFIIITFKAEVNNSYLAGLLKSEQAFFVFYVSCNKTCFRSAYKIPDKEYKITIDGRKVADRINITPYLIAAEPIELYSDSFGEDYAGIHFDVDTGCKLAIGDEITLVLSNNDRLKPFVFITNRDDETSKEIGNIKDIERSTIEIMLPKKIHSVFDKNQNNKMFKKFIISAVIVPATIVVLQKLCEKIKSDGVVSDQLYEYDWFRYFVKIVGSGELETLSDDKFMPLAQKIMKYSLFDAVTRFEEANEKLFSVDNDESD